MIDIENPNELLARFMSICAQKGYSKREVYNCFLEVLIAIPEDEWKSFKGEMIKEI